MHLNFSKRRKKIKVVKAELKPETPESEASNAR